MPIRKAKSIIESPGPSRQGNPAAIGNSASQLMRSKTFGIFLPYAAITTIGLVVGIIISKFSLLWMPYGSFQAV